MLPRHVVVKAVVWIDFPNPLMCSSTLQRHQLQAGHAGFLKYHPE